MISEREPGCDDDDDVRPAINIPELRREDAERDGATRAPADRYGGSFGKVSDLPTTPTRQRKPTSNDVAPAAGRRGDEARIVTMAAVSPREVDWLWPGRLPAGMVAVLDGSPGVGKSTVVLDLVARLTTGRALPNEVRASRAPAPVVLLGSEDSPEHTIRPRLDAAGADPACVHLIADIGGRMPRLPDDGDEIGRVVRQKSARLLVIDPVSAYIGQADFHRDNEVRAALAPLARIAEATGATVLMLRHLRKSGGTDAIGRGLGSVATIALARAGLMLLADPDDPQARILAWSKMSVAPVPQSLRWRWQAGGRAPRIAWEGPCNLTADDILARQDRAQKGEREGTATATDAAEAWLMDVLAATGAVPVADIRARAVAAGIAWRTVERAKSRLGVRARREGRPGEQGGGQWLWVAVQVKTANSERSAALAEDRDRDDDNPAQAADLGSGVKAANGLDRHTTSAALTSTSTEEPGAARRERPPRDSGTGVPVMDAWTTGGSRGAE